jgi:hypothetical protein
MLGNVMSGFFCAQVERHIVELRLAQSVVGLLRDWLGATPSSI